MTSFGRDDRSEDADLFMDDFLFQETDAFALPLLDFDPDGALLTPAELTMSQTHLQQTQLMPFPILDSDITRSSQHPASPVSTDDNDSTDTDVSTPPSAFVQRNHQQQQRSLCPSRVASVSATDAASSPTARVSLLSSSMSTHSPLPSEQKLLAPRTGNSNNSRSCVNATTPATTAKSMQPSKMLPMPSPASFAGALPYAMPVAYFPAAFNGSQKRSFPHMSPGATSPNATTRAPSSACAVSTAAAASPSADHDPNAKKSKREIRQMKNRESANKSRLRRKAQLTTLTTEVTELKKKEQELQTIIAGLRAENKSLLDQNTFLRSLATSFKPEPVSSRSNHQMAAAFTSLPSPVDQSCVALNMLESGQKMDVNGEMQAADMDLTMTRPGKRRAVTSTLSTASLAVCASVFGITVFADYDGGAVDSGNIRGVGRVLHEASTACGMEGCFSDTPTSLVGIVMTAVRSWWQFVSSSELVFGVLLNVLSFLAIVALYRLWQSHSEGRWSWKCLVFSMPDRRGVRDQADLSRANSSSKDEKKRNGSGRDARLREKLRTKNGTRDAAFM